MPDPRQGRRWRVEPFMQELIVRAWATHHITACVGAGSRDVNLAEIENRLAIQSQQLEGRRS